MPKGRSLYRVEADRIVSSMKFGAEEGAKDRVGSGEEKGDDIMERIAGLAMSGLKLVLGTSSCRRGGWFKL